MAKKGSRKTYEWLSWDEQCEIHEALLAGWTPASNALWLGRPLGTISTYIHSNGLNLALQDARRDAA